MPVRNHPNGPTAHHPTSHGDFYRTVVMEPAGASPKANSAIVSQDCRHGACRNRLQSQYCSACFSSFAYSPAPCLVMMMLVRPQQCGPTTHHPWLSTAMYLKTHQTVLVSCTAYEIQTKVEKELDIKARCAILWLSQLLPC